MLISCAQLTTYARSSTVAWNDANVNGIIDDGEATFTSFSNAIAAVQNGTATYIRLSSDTSFSDWFSIDNKEFTLDMNGHNLHNNYGSFELSGTGKMTVTDTGETLGTYTSYDFLAYVSGNATLIVEKGNYKNFLVDCWDDSNVIINGGTIDAQVCISSNLDLNGNAQFARPIEVGDGFCDLTDYQKIKDIQISITLRNGSLSVADHFALPNGMGFYDAAGNCVDTLNAQTRYTIREAETAPAAHEIKIVDSVGGTVTTNPSASAISGATVMLYVTPDTNYTFNWMKISIKDADGNPVSYDRVQSPFVFTMPDSDIEISVEFISTHTHSWKYTKDETTITATCTADGCSNPDGGSVKLIVKDAPYTGEAVGATTEGAFTNGATFKITYDGAETAPNAVGILSATLTAIENGEEKASITCSYNVDYIDAPNPAYYISGYRKDNTYWLKEGDPIVVTPPAGYNISKYVRYYYDSSVTFAEGDKREISLKRISDGAITKAIPVTETIAFDGKAATGKITIENRGFWEKLLNKISFGLFYKGDVVATVTADDNESGVASVQYYVASEDLINNGSTAALDALTWTPYEDEIALNKNAKNVVYVKITDNVGNVTYLNSEGIVLYSDASAVTQSVTTTYKAEADKEVTIALNGNTVKEIKNGTDVVNSDSYTVSADGKITLKGSYLDTLNAGTYTFTVAYNPLGETYVDETNNDAPATTAFKVIVEKAEGKVSDIDISGKTYDGTPVSAPTFNKLGDGAATVEYKVKGADDNTYTATAPTNAGDYVVRVTVAEGTNHKVASATAEFSIDRAELTDVSVEQDGKLTYNGKEQTPSVVEKATAINEQTVTFVYSINENDNYGTMPVFTNAGSYTVYYKASAQNHNDKAGSFTVTIDKATVTEPTIEGKPYSGSVQTADIVDNELYTVEQNNGGTVKGSYDVVIKLKDVGNYKWSTTDNAEVTLKLEITKAENTWKAEPSIDSWTYGETAKDPAYEAKFGEVKVTYSGEAYDGTSWNKDSAPTKAGNYFAEFTVDETENYNGLSERVSFEIMKATYNMSSAKWNYTAPFQYDGKEHKVEVVGLPEGVTVESYENNTATSVGDYYAKANLAYDANNYKAPSINTIGWTIYNDWTPTEYAVSGEGWVNSDFVITANDGYMISLTNTDDGEWKDKLIYSAETDNGSVTFYLRNTADDTISLEKTVSYKLDKTAPTGRVDFVDRSGWEEFVNAITFGLFYKDEVTVKIDGADALSGIAKIEYCTSAEALSLDQVKEIADWTEYNGEFGVALEDAKKFVYFVRITDNAGNVTYISTDGAEYDTTAPVISGVEDGKTYYTTQKIAVTDKNIDTVTVNGTPVFDPSEFSIPGNIDAEFVIAATDKAGNTTTFTVTMKPISEVGSSIEEITEENVNSEDRETVEAVIDNIDELLKNENITDDEKAALEETKGDAEKLIEKIDNAGQATDTENIQKVEEVTSENVTPEDKTDLEKAKDDLEKALEDYGDNYTDDEKKAIKDKISRIDAALEIISNVEAVEEAIGKLPENITRDDEDAVNEACEAYDALTDYEKSLVDPEAKKALEDAKATIEELKKPADVLSPQTTDNRNLWLWFALLFVSGLGVFGVVLNKKENTEEDI